MAGLIQQAMAPMPAPQVQQSQQIPQQMQQRPQQMQQLPPAQQAPQMPQGVDGVHAHFKAQIQALQQKYEAQMRQLNQGGGR